MEHRTKKIDDSRWQLEVELGREDLDNYIKTAEKDILADLEVDGFRKGKVPKDMLRKHVPDEKILEAAMDRALKTSFLEAIEKNKWDVLNTADLEIKENSKDKLLYSIKVAVYPEVTPPELKEVKIPKRKVETNEKEVEETINTIRNSRAKLSTKQEPADIGDRVELDFEVAIDGKPIEGGSSKNHPLVLGKGSFIPGFEDSIKGMSQGEEKEFSLTAPDNYFEKNIAGKKLDFKVKLNLVQKVELPELTDDFAREIGKFPNAVALRENVKVGILEEKKIKEKERLRLEILDALVQKASVPAPKDMIEVQLDNMLSDFDGRLHQQGLELGFYLAHIKKTQDELKKEWEKDAIKQVKTNLIIHAISKSKGITATGEEIEAQLNQVVDMLAARGQAESSKIDVGQLREHIARQIVTEKTLQLIEDLCSI